MDTVFDNIPMDWKLSDFQLMGSGGPGYLEDHVSPVKYDEFLLY